MKQVLDENRIHRDHSIELVPWPELPPHPHQPNEFYTNKYVQLIRQVSTCIVILYINI